MDRYHSQLLSPAAYPDPTKTVSFRETHISRVYLTDTRAYKLKKPLNLGFLDFSTLERRHYFCREEVRLNSRFAPDTYLGVTELAEEHGRVRFAGPGTTIDYAVCMKRLPEELMLDRLVEQAAPSLPGRIPELAEELHRIFTRAEPCTAEHPSSFEVVEGNCRENLLQTRASIGQTLSSEAHHLMERVTERDLSDLEDLIHKRESQGFVRDGHGDLHTRNICMTDPIQVYDCIEFNRRFRVADIAADLAFLLMDLEFRGRRDLAEQLLAAYQNKAADQQLPELLPFYKRYRAWVRGKVNAMLAEEDDAPAGTRHKARQSARRYFNQALGYATQPALVVMTGLMGTGKTTLAEALAGVTGAVVLRSDIIRKRLASLSPETSSPDDYGEGLYNQEMTRKTYGEMYRLCAELLMQGHPVVVDASFADPAQRHRFLGLAADRQVCGYVLQTSCPDEVALTRLDRREHDVSDGRRAIYWQQAEGYVGPGQDEAPLVIDSNRDLDENLQAVLCHQLTIQEQPA